MPKILTFTFNQLQEHCYVVDLCNGDCIIIDPGFHFENEKQTLMDSLQGLTPKAILLTHGHFDHSLGIPKLLKKYDIPVYMGQADKDLPFEKFQFTDIHDGEELKFSEVTFKVIATPGHTQGSVCYLLDNVLFSGDTLFADTIGRTDLPGGDYDKIITSLMEKLMVLDSDTKVLPGHGPSTNIGHERTHNPFLQPFNEPEPDPDEDVTPIELHP